MTVAGMRGLMVRAPSSTRAPYPLPFPFSPSELATIEAAFTLAWSRVLGVPLPASADEKYFTEQLVFALDALLSDPKSPVDGFDGDLCEMPIRGGELRNYDDQHVEKRPDLVVRRAGKTEYAKQFCGLFVECKLVDRTHPVGLYCSSGIDRFVQGDYAWALPLAMMIAYAGASYTLPATLEKHFVRKGITNDYGMVRKTLTSPSSGSQLWESEHRRSWFYPKHRGGGRPGNIKLRHLWLSLSGAVGTTATGKASNPRRSSGAPKSR